MNGKSISTYIHIHFVFLCRRACHHLLNELGHHTSASLNTCQILECGQINCVVWLLPDTNNASLFVFHLNWNLWMNRPNRKRIGNVRDTAIGVCHFGPFWRCTTIHKATDYNFPKIHPHIKCLNAEFTILRSVRRNICVSIHPFYLKSKRWSNSLMVSRILICVRSLCAKPYRVYYFIWQVLWRFSIHDNQWMLRFAISHPHYISPIYTCICTQRARTMYIHPVFESRVARMVIWPLLWLRC